MYTKYKITKLKILANKGDIEAQYILGARYDYGKEVLQDHKKAVDWYTKAAQQGHAMAQTALGVCYANGEGVSQDYNVATQLFKKAAKQQNRIAQYNLAYCYANGIGIAKNLDIADNLFKSAGILVKNNSAIVIVNYPHLRGEGLKKP